MDVKEQKIESAFAAIQLLQQRVRHQQTAQHQEWIDADGGICYDLHLPRVSILKLHVTI